MVAWFFCACCSGARDRRQQYRYEVVYRREESLYSGQDYLESLPGGRSSLPNQRTPPLRQEGAPANNHLPIEQGRYPLPLPTPTGAESLVRQNRVNHFLTTLNEQGPPGRPPIYVRGGQGPRFHAWRSTNYLVQPQGHHLTPFNPRFPGNRNILHSRSAPLLALPGPNVSFGTSVSGPLPVHSRDQSLSSRDLSLASSANSSRPLLSQGRGHRPHHLNLRPLQPPPISPFRPLHGPRSPHTPLSPGPPGYPPSALGDTFLHRYPPPGSLTRDLRQYLSTRFPKGGVDHDLQNTIRDNVYLRTVPVTTRPPRQGEVNGVDYTFLSQEEFQGLQRSGNLLEAGIFEGNHYGTPKPPAQGGEVCRGSSSILSGAHPSSEGKRRRNRSNVEAMAANILDTPLPNPVEAANLPFRGPVPYQSPQDEPHFPTSELGPLPPNWEKAYTENGEPYYIDHVAGTSSWLDPRLARIQKRSAEECQENELPFGWERIDDPQYGTYYIDHVNRKTQYENPVIIAKQQQPDDTLTTIMNESISSTFPRPKKPVEINGSNQKVTENGQTYHSKRSHSRAGTSSNFTRNPSDLKGEFLRTTLVKSSRGLGFTIVGGDDNEEEFLQIKSVVPNGPAWQDGKLRTGDVLVYVGDTCVLGYTHADVVNMFQNIEPGRTVYLEVCRGYPLPFDPNDPNTEIVTTVAVTSADSRSAKSAFGEEYDSRSRNNSNESMNTAKSMPDLSNTERIQQVPRPGSADLLSSENYEPNAEILEFYPSTLSKPDYLTIPIVKGSMGFGFTIADSAYGQKVKKILDRSRCKNLAESDILVDINNINVKGMSHTEVVQVLKECPQGYEAIVMVQRGGLSSPSKSRAGTRKDPISSPKKSSATPSSGGMYRSKTPTADMYSSQPKEIIPNRPKTPLVDTRNRPKTPTSYNDRENMDAVNTSGEFQPQHNPNHPPYPGAFSYTGTNSMEQGRVDHKVNNLTSQLNHTSLNGNSFDHSSEKFNVYSQDSQDSNNGNYNYHPEIYNSKTYQHSFEYEKENFNKNAPNHAEPFTQYSYYNSNQPNGNVNSYGESMDQFIPDQHNSYGYIPYPKEGYDVPRQDSGYSSQAQIPPSRNPYPPYYGQNSSVGYSGPQPDGYMGPPEVQRRKESTSFELELPAPVTMPRFQAMNSGSIPRHGPEGRGTPNLDMGNLPYHEFTVTLPRQEHGFGFRIVGGTEEGSQVSIGHIVPGGSADLDGRIISGDEIICVDGEVVLGSSHHRVVELMASAANHGRVTVTLRRPLHISSPPSDIHNQSMEMQQFPYDVTVTRRENEGFGFVIISSVAKSGSTIGRILTGSPAERCPKLQVGDRILRVNGIDIKSLHHGSIVNLIKESGYEVTLTIGPPRDDTSSTASNSQRAESDIGDEGELYHVELSRGNRGFGFSIRGGREFHNMPLFVLRIAENGPAAEDSKLKVGDQLIEINGVSTKDMTHADAIELIKQCGTTVGLIVKRGGKLSLHMDPLSPMSASNLGSPVGPPPPGTHIRSTATLPSGSPGSSHMSPYPQNSTQHYGYTSQPNMMIPSYQSTYPSNEGNSRPPQPLHSSPATQYPQMPLNPHASNGPLGQSSPRVSVPPDSYYWNKKFN